MQMMCSKLKKRSGFTLLELLVVMVILVILAGVVTVLVVSRIEDARHARAVADIKSLEDALETYNLHNKSFPESLNALRVKPDGPDLPNWNGPYIKHDIPKDPWDRDYIYKCPGEHSDFDLSSLGKDGKKDGKGADADIESWNLK